MIETLLIALGIMFILTFVFNFGVYVGSRKATELIYNQLNNAVKYLNEKAAKEAAEHSAEHSADKVEDD